MKYLIPLFFILLSCGPETKMNEYNYIIENGTNQMVSIEFYFLDELQKTISLSPNQSYLGEEIETTVDLDSMPNSAGPSTSFGADLIKVIYDNERISNYSFTGIDNGLGNFSIPELRNLLRTGNYNSIGNEVYQFTLTQQDFDNATPCDGPCE